MPEPDDDGLQANRSPGRHFAAIPALFLANPFQATPITVEAAIRRGLPGFQISGIARPGEIADRIRSAIGACGERLPGARLQVNLAPVDIRKSGAYLDLAVAVSLLLAVGPPPDESLLRSLLIPKSSTGRPVLFLGELSLSGRLLPVERLPALLREARRHGFGTAVIPLDQIPEARLIRGIRVIGIESLSELIGPEIFPLARDLDRPISLQMVGVAPPLSPRLDHLELDPRARRALAIAAAGWHSMVLIGPPGMGKTSLAREVAPLLPPPDGAECLEILIARDEPTPGDGVWRIARPVRAPHHSCTRAAMVGGGAPPTPGEITRANHGVLLLDELPEFSRDTLQALREPMEAGYVDISRGRGSVRFPARFLLVATTNPCPCGQHQQGCCKCGPGQMQHYINRILGPLRDRIDLEVRVEPSWPGDEITDGAELRAMVASAIRLQNERFRGETIRFNGDIAQEDLHRLAPLVLPEAQREWREIVNSGRYSYRSLAGIRRLARTIADLNAVAEIRPTDLQEALYYRCLDIYWSDYSHSGQM